MPRKKTEPGSSGEATGPSQHPISGPSPSGDTEAWRHSNMGRILNNAVNRFERRVAEILEDHGHGEARQSHFHLTRNLDRAGTITTELARRAGMTKQAMGQIVEQCELIGLVERCLLYTSPSPRDS